MSLIRFDDITPIVEQAYIGGIEYELRETSGGAAVKYDNARLRCYEYQEGKLVRMHDLADLEPLLVSLCLFDTEGKEVSEKLIRSWPHRVQKALFERAKELSGMYDSVQSIEEQIEKLQKQLADSKAKEDLSKN
jgi:hypothetical protein